MSDVPGLFAHTAAGAAWSGIGRTVGYGIEFVTALVLARLLGPDAFGLVAMVLVVVRLGDVFTDLGMSAALVQRRNISAGAWRAAFLTNAAAGVAASVVVFSASPLLASFYGRAELGSLVRGISVYFVIRAATLVGQARLIRELRLRDLALMEIGSAVCGGVAGVGLALGGLGPASILVQILVQVAVLLLLLLPSTAPLLREGRATLTVMRELWLFARGITGFALVNYLARNADDLLIGRFAGAPALGLYNRAYALMLMPIGQITRVLDRVVFPVLSRLQDDLPRLRRAYLRALGMVAVLSFPVFGLAVVLGDEVVRVVLGSDWAAAGTIFRILAVAGFWQSVGATTSWLYKSTGQTDLMFRWGLISTGITIAAFAVGLRWGAIGVAVAYVIRGVALAPWGFSIPGRAIELTFSHVLVTIWRPALAALVGALIALAIRHQMSAAPDLVVLLLGTTVALTGYVLLLAGMHSDALRDLRLLGRSAERGA